MYKLSVLNNIEIQNVVQKMFWTQFFLRISVFRTLSVLKKNPKKFWTLKKISKTVFWTQKKMCFLCSEHLKTQTIPIAWQSGLFQQAQLTWKGVKVNRLPYSLRSNGFRGANY